MEAYKVLEGRFVGESQKHVILGKENLKFCKMPLFISIMQNHCVNFREFYLIDLNILDADVYFS